MRPDWSPGARRGDEAWAAGGNTAAADDASVSRDGAAAAATNDVSAEAWCLAFVRSANDAIIGMRLDGTITSWNPAAERLYGYSEHEIIGRSISVLAAPERYEELRRLRRALEHGIRIRAFNTVRVHKDGQPIEVEMTLSPVFDAHGAVIGVSGVTRDNRTPRTDDGPPDAARADLESRIVASAAQLQRMNAELQKQVRARERLAGRLLTLQDEERRRIGRELHDSTAQNLVALDMNLARLTHAGAPPAGLADTLADSRALVAECLREIRTLSYLLHPPLLDESGLTSAIRWYADGFARRSGIEVTTDIDPKLGRLSREAEMALFRITQECLTNVHRHAGSPTVSIRLKRRPTAVILEVEDTGHGMTAAQHLADTGRNAIELGVGISGMRDRVRRLGGQLIIASSVRGTSVHTSVPLSAAHNPRRKPAADHKLVSRAG